MMNMLCNDDAQIYTFPKFIRVPKALTISASQSLGHPGQLGRCSYLCLACKHSALCILGVEGMSEAGILSS